MDIIEYRAYEYNSFDKSEKLIATFYDKDRVVEYVEELDGRGYYELFFHYAIVYSNGTEIKVLD